MTALTELAPHATTTSLGASLAGWRPRPAPVRPRPAPVRPRPNGGRAVGGGAAAGRELPAPTLEARGASDEGGRGDVEWRADDEQRPRACGDERDEQQHRRQVRRAG